MQFSLQVSPAETLAVVRAALDVCPPDQLLSRGRQRGAAVEVLGMPEILVLYYSRTGATAELARHVCRGIESVQGASAKLRTVPPVMCESEGPAKLVPASGAPYATMEDLRTAAAQSAPVLSRKYLSGAAMLPKRVGLPITRPAAVRRSSNVA